MHAVHRADTKIKPCLFLKPGIAVAKLQRQCINVRKILANSSVGVYNYFLTQMVKA